MNLCTPMFIVAQFTIAKCWKQPKCPSAKWVDQKTMVHLHNRILHSRKKGGAYTLCNSMDVTGEHYAKWNKPGGEGQIPYDLIFHWNIINKRKKKTKYNRDIEIKHNSQRGGRRGQWGEGFSGTTTKDTWTKPRGTVKAREGGGFGWGGGRKYRQL